eukprot:s2706_g6.t1
MRGSLASHSNNAVFVAQSPAMVPPMSAAPPLFEPNGGPNALLATVALAQRQPKGLKKLLRAMLDKEGDPMRSSPQLAEDSEPVNERKPENFLRRFAEGTAIRAGLPHPQNVVNLSDWLGKVLAEHKDRAAESLVHFLRSRFMSETGQPLTTFRQPPPLPASVDEAAVVYRCQTQQN